MPKLRDPTPDEIALLQSRRDEADRIARPYVAELLAAVDCGSPPLLIPMGDAESEPAGDDEC